VPLNNVGYEVAINPSDLSTCSSNGFGYKWYMVSYFGWQIPN